jgi:hypothetical protein
MVNLKCALVGAAVLGAVAFGSSSASAMQNGLPSDAVSWNLQNVRCEPAASDFVVEVWVAKRWRPIARSEYEADRRLFERASYKCPTDILIRLRHGSDVLIKMPANGLERVREQ